MRLFVAAWPSPTVVADLAAVPRVDRSDVRWTTEDQWHVTLRFLGTVDTATPVIDALQPITEFAPVDLTLGPRTKRLGAVLCVPVDGLESIATAVVHATRTIGEAPDDRPFRGHITLARAKGRGKVPNAPDLVGLPISGAWTVATIAVVVSHLGASGARYETVAEVPLRGRRSLCTCR
jgi:2'-5' RNA ligase